MMKDFKAFLLRGNVVDLAVGVVIGTAFGGIVKSIVEDLIMPLIAVLGGLPDFTSLKWTVNDATITYGNFLTALVSFAIVASVIFFFVVRPMNALLARMQSGKEAEPEPRDPQIELLEEIRDLLKKR
jgi:large conductance mechanosensitive channel